MCDELANKRIASKGPLWRMKESLPNICIFCLFKLDKKDFASLSLTIPTLLIVLDTFLTFLILLSQRSIDMLKLRLTYSHFLTSAATGEQGY